jgi:hypothetical protein
MQADERFRSRLRADLGERPQPPVGTLAADALSAGQRLRRRQRTLRTVGGAAAVAAVAVGSVTLSGAFGADTGSSAVGPGGTTVAVPTSAAKAPGAGAPTSSRPAPPPPSLSTGAPVTAPPAWVLPPAAKVADPEWVTPRAIVAELQKILPQGTQTSGFSGGYAYGGGDPREQWAVTGALTAATAKGPVKLQATLHKFDGDLTKVGCTSDCTLFLLPGGGKVELGYISGEGKVKFVWLFRPDGMSVQINAYDASKISDDELFALAADGAWGSLKMEKSFVQHAESTIKGDFTDPPSAG